MNFETVSLNTRDRWPMGFNAELGLIFCDVVGVRYEAGLALSPTGMFDDVDHERLLDCAGYLTQWAVACPEGIDMEEWVKECYGFPSMDSSGTVADDGVFRYPEDPDLHPLFKIWKGDTEVYFYQHAMIAFKKDGKFTITRMD